MTFNAFTILPRLFLAFLAVVGAASCGSGAVTNVTPVTDPTRITILPSTATLYAGVPTTFVISGGTGSYILSSSNQTVIPVSGSISGNTLIVTPNQVGADTDVTLTVRDTGTTPLATATLTVRPGTVSNDLTVTPSSTQGLNCLPAVCSGGDAVVVATLSQAGVPLAGRLVRFDAISGDYRFVTSSTGSTIETLDTSVSVPTDQSGRALARIRVTAGAANQTALLQATDMTSGSFQRTSFVVSQATGTSPGFFATPSSITFQGRRLEECAGTDISAVFYVFGGTPPYIIANTISTLIVRPEVVTSSGGGFTVTPTGACIGLPGVPITIRDAASRTTSVNVANIPGTAAIPALSASPSTVNLTSCDASANIQIAGGRSGTYFVASGSDALIATISGSTVTVRRRNPSGPSAASGTIGISDGTSVVNVTVAISGVALGACPSAGFTASPTSVTLSDCSSAAQVILSGGSGSYSAAASTGSIRASISGNVLSIQRVTPSSAFSSGTVAVSDGASSITISVSGSGAGAGACGGGGGLSASPSSVTLTDCSSAAFVSISGASGTISAASSSPSVSATVNGSLVTIRRTNQSAAFGGGTVVVADGSSSVTITVNASGAGAGACTSGGLSANPTSVTLTDCSSSAFVSISGASGSVSATSSSPSVSATVSGSLLTIRRTSPSSAFGGGTVILTDNSSSVSITVNASGAGAGACTTQTQPITASPSSITLTDCSGTVQTTLSGGSGNYSAASSSGSITSTVSGSILSVRRTNPSNAFSGGSVTVSDGTSTTSVPVNASGAGAGACPTPATPVSVSPSSVTLTDCSGSAQVAVSGGSGSYSAASSSGSFTVTVSGNIVSIRRTNPSSAVSGATVIVTDGSTAANVTVNATGAGAGACPTPAPAITVSPSSLTLSDCSGAVQATISGGSGAYTAASNSGSVSASVSGSVLTVRRVNPSSAFSGATVTVSDGSSTTAVSVNGTGAGAGSCPTPGAAFAATPTTVTLSDCSGAAQVTLSGGSGNYSASSQNGSVTASLSGNVVSIRRTVPSSAFSGGTVLVSDGSTSISITVNASGAGAGSCPSSSSLSVSPSSVTLVDCNSSPNVVISGGTGTYTVAASNVGLVLTSSGNILTISRRRPSDSFSSPQTVTISDGTSTATVSVNANPTPFPACL